MPVVAGIPSFVERHAVAALVGVQRTHLGTPLNWVTSNSFRGIKSSDGGPHRRKAFVGINSSFDPFSDFAALRLSVLILSIRKFWPVARRRKRPYYPLRKAGVAKLVYAPDSKSGEVTLMSVRVRPPAPFKFFLFNESSATRLAS